ncbi:MEKHLA domain-containing protein [Micromonospora ureilytica]|uniref:MEKHLA domain-containing protein n=1 Tax=Micromonospora ureilytica TaxID=709868 RepID=UPI0033E6A3F0
MIGGDARLADGRPLPTDGEKFSIENVTIWNLVEEGGHLVGQAALIRRWIQV